MNSLQELLDNGIELYTAENMLKDYSNRIDTMNGIYKIIDINYDFSVRGKDVTLQCTECDKVIHRIMISGRNKWSELIKSCPCQKKRKAEQKKADFEKFQKIKKDYFEEKLDFCVGMQFGDFVVAERNSNKGLTVRCNTCGYEKQIGLKSFENKSERTMHCTKHFQAVKYDERYIGEKRNYLTVLGIEKTHHAGKRMYICQCDCGKKKLISPFHWDNGIVKSCGCYFESLQLEHSEELDRLRRIHNGMMQRCYNKKSDAYKNYGGRGIEICAEWHDREKFVEWALDNGYENKLTIDRIDVNGNYEPNNCRWADWSTQANNRRPTEEWKKRKKRKQKTAIIDGEEKTLMEWYEIYGVTAPTVSYRMKMYGLNFEDALKMPRIASGRPRKEVV